MSTTFLHDGPITLNNGLVGSTWQVATANPTTFHQAISAPQNTPSTEIFAQTFLPESVNNPPVVIVIPGSMGVAPSHVKKAELFTNAGIACCLLDPFGARGVTTTVANQAQFSFAASAWDVLATMDQLAARGQIDVDRIGTQGHSRGGSAILSALCMSRHTGFTAKMCGAYAAYPWSGQQFLNPHVGTTKVRSVVGDQDEWCSAQQIQGHIQAIRLAGGNASCRIFAGAHHSFDRETPVEMVAEASVARGAPTIYIDDTGASIHPVTGERDPDASERDLMLYGIKAGYGKRGARLGTSGNFAADFHADMMAFWQQCLQV